MRLTCSWLRLERGRQRRCSCFRPHSNSRSSGRTGFLSGMMLFLATSRGIALRMSAGGVAGGAGQGKGRLQPHANRRWHCAARTACMHHAQARAAGTHRMHPLHCCSSPALFGTPCSQTAGRRGGSSHQSGKRALAAGAGQGTRCITRRRCCPIAAPAQQRRLSPAAAACIDHICAGVRQRHVRAPPLLALVYMLMATALDTRTNRSTK